MQETWDTYVKEQISPGSMSERTALRLSLTRSIEEQIALQMRDISGATVPPEEVVRLAKSYISGSDTMGEILLKLEDLGHQSVSRIGLNERYARGEVGLEEAQAKLEEIRANIRAVAGDRFSSKPSSKKKFPTEAEFQSWSPQKQQEFINSGGE
jgi:hypothetical protein